MTSAATRRYASLFAFLVGVTAIGAAIGYLTGPGEWYAALEKPAFNPPSWVFGPVWSILYVMIAISGWLIWRSAPDSMAMALWIGQMILNFAWSPAFFGLESPWLALAIIVLLDLAILAFILEARRHERVASLLFVPYAAWVAFATLLNGAIAVMN